ncbi:hypothetical protein M1E17_03750 [Arthrobacter sp. D1-29]
MTDGGGRVSLYVAVPSTPAEDELEAAAALVAGADLALIHLSELGLLLLEREEVRHTPLWVDLHDSDGSSAEGRDPDPAGKANSPYSARLRACSSRSRLFFST